MQLTEVVGDLLRAEPGDSTGAHWDGLYVDRNQVNLSLTILIFSNREREVVKEDVDHMRVVLAELGYREVKSWASYAGQSWLSDGVFVGVSFEVDKVVETS